MNKRKILYCHGGNIAIAGYSLIVGTNWHYRDRMQRRLASKGELHAVGLTDATTSFGNTVRVYDMERTICDIVRSRSTMETQVYQDALKQYSDFGIFYVIQHYKFRTRWISARTLPLSAAAKSEVLT